MRWVLHPGSSRAARVFNMRGTDESRRLIIPGRIVLHRTPVLQSGLRRGDGAGGGLGGSGCMAYYSEVLTFKAVPLSNVPELSVCLELRGV